MRINAAFTKSLRFYHQYFTWIVSAHLVLINGFIGGISTVEVQV